MVLHSSEVQLVAGGRDGAVQDPRHLQRVTRKVQGGEEEKEFGGLIKFPHLPRARTQSHGSTERQWLLGSAVPTGWLISQARCGKGGHIFYAQVDVCASRACPPDEESGEEGSTGSRFLL